jgi:carbonic anhydrase
MKMYHAYHLFLVSTLFSSKKRLFKQEFTMKKRSMIRLFLFLFLVIGSFGNGYAGGPSSGDSFQQMRNMMKNILGDNQAFQNDPAHTDAYFKRLAAGQSPRSTVISCSDSRVQTACFDQFPMSDIFFVRNIGNQLEPNAGSIDYGVLHLKSPLLLFLGHSSCGAVQAATKGTEGLEKPIQKELETLQVLHKTPNPTEMQIRENIYYNVHAQVDRAFTKYKNLIDEKKLWVVGAVYDFTPTGKGSLQVIQVNDQIDRKAIESFLNDVEQNGRNDKDPGRP